MAQTDFDQTLRILELEKLVIDTLRANAERDKLAQESDKLRAERYKLSAEELKLDSEAAKLTRDGNLWRILGIMAAGSAFTLLTGIVVGITLHLAGARP